ncbi:MAG: hypothetical protein QXL01_04270 [Thermoplasmatales archaeon]
MEKKEEKRRRILPPIEDLVNTPDLVNEALKKVIPPSPTPLSNEQSDKPRLQTKVREEKAHEDDKLKKKSTARSQYSSDTIELSHDDSATIEPSHLITELQYNPAISYPSRNYLITPHFLLDEVLPTLNPYEQSLLLRLYRLSYGFRRNTTDPVGKKTLADKCNMSLGMVKKVLKSLEKRGLIKTIPDKSNDPTKGNRYRVLTGLQDNPVLKELSHNITRSPHDPKKINIDDSTIKNKNHHLIKTKELYENITGNRWTKNDDDSYLKVKDCNLQIIEQALMITTKRAKSSPNSFEFFVKQIQRFESPTEEERKKLKKELGQIVNLARQIRVGGDQDKTLEEDVQQRCEWEGIFFDKELYNEIIDESRYGHWEPDS